MTENEVQQIKNIITNLEEKKGYIPYMSELENHDIFGPVFNSLDIEQKKNVKKIIDEYIVAKIESMKTKGGVLFKRFYEIDPDLFRNFRDLNEKEDEVGSVEFQETGKKVEQEMFKLEGILTERMLKQEKGLDKVVGSFYNIVYNFFPKYGRIE